MDSLSWNLVFTALGIAVVHTAAGPDHFLPFIMLARARRWTLATTLWVTFLCGIGHVGSSVLLGSLGLALGFGVAHVEKAESVRGSFAAWCLMMFGVAYALWGVRHALRRGTGLVLHEHDGQVHIHHRGHVHHDHHSHGDARSQTTFWMLFAVFVLGPCEPLIPLFVLPASLGRWDLAGLTALVFGAATIATMLALVGLSSAGVRALPLGFLNRWSHAMAGGVIAASGLAVLFLSL